MTCRDELLEAVKVIIKRKGKNEFSIPEVIEYMKQKGTRYKEATIRTHITSRCCKNAPANHGVVYADFLRIRKGVYKLLNEN